MSETPAEKLINADPQSDPKRDSEQKLSPYGHTEAYHRRWRFFWREIWMQRMVFPTTLRLRVTGRENIPTTGPVIAIYNHVSSADPSIVVGSIRNRYLIPMAKIETLDNFFFGLVVRTWNCIVVRRGEVDRTALTLALNVLNTGGGLTISPEGTRSPAMIESKEGTAYLATKTDAVVVPVGVAGSGPYMTNLKRLRRTPVEMVIGRGFKFRTNGRTRIPRDELAQMSRESSYQIAQLLPPELRGFYSDLSQATTDTLEFV